MLCVETSVRDQDVFIVQSGSQKINDSVFELLIMVSACKGGSSKSITGTLDPIIYSSDIILIELKLYCHTCHIRDRAKRNHTAVQSQPA